MLEECQTAALRGFHAGGDAAATFSYNRGLQNALVKVTKIYAKNLIFRFFCHSEGVERPKNIVFSMTAWQTKSPEIIRSGGIAFIARRLIFY